MSAEIDLPRQLHAHTWRQVGRCTHPHPSGSTRHALYVCEDPACTTFAHAQRTVALSYGRRARAGLVPPADCPLIEHRQRAIAEARREQP